MRVVVVALGKIGLPIAAQAARFGHQVTGCDTNPEVVAAVNSGRAPFPGEAGLQELLKELVDGGSLRASTDTTAAVAEGADLVIAVPPLIVDDQAHPDYRILDAVIEDIGRGLKPGTVVSVETTLPVHTTRKRLAPALETHSRLHAERDFFVVHSPERVYSGRVFKDLDTYPKLIGGLSPEGEDRAAELYESFLNTEVRKMGSAEAAELTKLAETTYRDVNIALANEFARYADREGLDLQRVIDAANSQPFSHIHRPGVAVGGHCIPVYPRFYLEDDPAARLPALARQINESMPAYAVDLLAGALKEELAGKTVLLLGVTYRGGVKETAFSGALSLREELSSRGAKVLASDPLYTPAELSELGFSPWGDELVDGAILQADHEQYRELTPADIPGIRAIVDGRGILERRAWEAAGVTLRQIGHP